MSVCLCVPFTDSMIRVGGDYQAQIPEFKPGKLGDRKAWEKGRWVEVGNQGWEGDIERKRNVEDIKIEDEWECRRLEDLEDIERP